MDPINVNVNVNQVRRPYHNDVAFHAINLSLTACTCGLWLPVYAAAWWLRHRMGLRRHW